MRQFRILFVLFALLLLAPLGLLVQRALHSFALERQMRHQAVAERVFDEMERGLSRLLDDEEQRPVGRYESGPEPRDFPFIIGHFEIDPEGQIHAMPVTSERDHAARAEIERAVGAYWHTERVAATAPMAGPAQVPGTTIILGITGQPGPAPAPAAQDEAAASKDVSAFSALRSLNKGALERVERQRKLTDVMADHLEAKEVTRRQARQLPSSDAPVDSKRSDVEFPSMTGRVIDDRHMLLYRTVLRDTRGYRQGVLLDINRLTGWLQQQGLGDGLAAYADVAFATPFAIFTSAARDSAFNYQHRFAEPFDALSARLSLRPLPGVSSVTYVYALSALLLGMGVLGLAALYRMVSVVVSFAERRNNFVAAVSHELKTPLTAIRMYGEMLRDGVVPSEAKRAQYYRHITVESERLSRLINNVLEFSRLEKDTRTVELVVGSVVPVVREVAELLRHHVEAEGFELRVEIDDRLPTVRFERDALVQVLCNLVDNAVKYAGGASPKQIVLHCWHDYGSVHVSVRDHGPGVPPRHMGKIFEPFYRGESELTRRSKGTGLGLALVRGLVERMGARVSSRNAPDGGFEVDIAFGAAPS